MSELTSMMNIGKEMARKLTSVGIASSEKLVEAGLLKPETGIPLRLSCTPVHIGRSH